MGVGVAPLFAFVAPGHGAAAGVVGGVVLDDIYGLDVALAAARGGTAAFGCALPRDILPYSS